MGRQIVVSHSMRSAEEMATGMKPTERLVSVSEALKITARELDRSAWQEAEQSSRRILRVDPNNSEAEFLLGKAEALVDSGDDPVVDLPRSGRQSRRAS
jgi:hypothetical protein